MPTTCTRTHTRTQSQVLSTRTRTQTKVLDYNTANKGGSSLQRDPKGGPGGPDPPLRFPKPKKLGKIKTRMQACIGFLAYLLIKSR